MTLKKMHKRKSDLFPFFEKHDANDELHNAIKISKIYVWWMKNSESYGRCTDVAGEKVQLFIRELPV